VSEVKKLNLNGLLLIDKERGPSSAEIVRQVSRLVVKKVRVGHAGTLDPDASGLLVLLLGPATKLSDFVMSLSKIYEAVVRFGIETDTYDATGKTLSEKDTSDLSSEKVESLLDEFRGTVRQVPPAFSAIKIQGKRSYEFARRGEMKELPERETVIYELKLLKFDSPETLFYVKCGKGMYLRTLAHDLGKRLGCGAHVKTLRRLAIGEFTPSVKVSDLTVENIKDFLVSPSKIFDEKKCFKLNFNGAMNLRRGIPLRAIDFIVRPLEPVGERTGVLDEEGNLIAVAVIGHGGSMLERKIVQPL